MASPRRNTELGLLVLAALITVGLYVLAALGRFATLPADITPFLAFLLVLLLAAHLGTRRFVPLADGILLAMAGLLNGIGYVFIARLDEDLAGLQSTWTAIGIGAFLATLVLVRRSRLLANYRYTFLFAGLVLLLVPLLPVVGREINGARIWASLGPINFQPGEFAKLCLAVFFAGYLVDKRELLAVARYRLGPLHLPDLKHLAPVMLAWAASLVVMIVEKDLGSSLLFFALFIVLLWIATERVFYLILGTGLFAGGAFYAWTTFDHVQVRIDAWLDPWSDPSGAGYQPIQAAFAMADGGITGTGPGLGNPVPIPAAETDFIFASIAEELGLFGGTAVLMAYMLMVGSGLRIALRADRAFDKLLAAGLTVLIGVQAFIIIGGVIRLLPLTGVTLPFVSYGGSSLVANYILLALLLRISQESEARALSERSRLRRRAAAGARA